jgi:GNAT superfamily N-acetyltransferase
MTQTGRALPELRALESAGPEFAPLTFPRYRGLLAPGRQDVTAIGLLAGQSSLTLEGEEIPVGLALLWKQPEQAQMLLLSIRVHRLYRGQGVAGELLARAESAARSQGAASLATTYSSRLPRRVEFERLLDRGGWSAPEVSEVRGAAYAAAVAAEMDRLEPAHRPYLPPGARIEPWSSVTESERGEVDALAAGIAFSAFLSPSLYEKTAHPELSIVLRLNGRIAGWVFGERHSDELCYYPCGYIIPALYRRASYVALIREVCRAQAALFGPKSVAQLSATTNVPGLPRFMRKRLAPCALWYDEMWRSTKQLLPASA